jgi:hypothetical protein
VDHQEPHWRRIGDNWMEVKGFKDSKNVFHHKWWNKKINEIIDKSKINEQID